MRKFCFCLVNYSIDVFYMVTRPNTTNSIAFISSLNNSPVLKFCSKDLKDYYDLHQNIYCQSPDFGRKCCCCCLIRQLLLGYLRSGPSPFMFALSKRERERVRERERERRELGVCVRVCGWVYIRQPKLTSIKDISFPLSYIALVAKERESSIHLSVSLWFFCPLCITTATTPPPHSTNVCNTDARIDERLLDRQEQEENSNTFVNRNEQTYIHW